MHDISNVLRKVFPRRGNLNNLCKDIVVVFQGLRTACLVDSLLVEEADALRLHQEFQKLGPQFEHLRVFYEQSTEQTFFINRDLLLLRVEFPIFVDVSGSEPRVLDSISLSPPHFDAAVNELVGELGLKRFCSLDLETIVDGVLERQSTMITLAGYLLDYSVAYTLINALGEASSTNCLGGRELSLITVSALKLEEKYLLFKFSFPASLPSSQGIIDALQAKMDHRVGKVKEWDSIEITTTAVLMDRLAL